MSRWTFLSKCSLSLLPCLFVASALGGCGDGYQDSEAPIIQVLPNEIEFEPTRANQTPNRKNVTIKSIGKMPLRIDSITFDSTDHDILDIDPAHLPETPVTLEPLHEIQVTIKFAPTVPGVNPSGTLTIQSNDPARAKLTVAVTTRPTSAMLTVEPSSLDWGTVAVTTRSGCSEPIQRRELELTNVGTDRLVIEHHSLTGLGDTTNPEIHFSVCPFESNIPHNRSVKWRVVFHPQSPGTHRAKVVLESTGGNAEVTLQGEGEGSGAIVVSPSTIIFSQVLQGMVAEMPLSVLNAGSTPFSVESITVHPESLRTQVAVIPDVIASLNPGASSSLRVTFRPDSADPIAGEIRVAHTAEDTPSPVVVTLYGNSALPQLLYQPASMRFSGVSPGESQGYSLVFSNGGKADLEITELSLGPNAGLLGWQNFAIEPDDFAASLPPEDTGRATIEVVYSRPAAGGGHDAACLNIHHNDPTQENPVCYPIFTNNTGTNLPPVAIIDVSPGASVSVGDTVTLDGTQSYDPDDDQSIASYSWNLVRRPTSSSASLSSTSGPEVTLTPDEPGSYEITLVVTDNSAASFTSPESRITISAN